MDSNHLFILGAQCSGKTAILSAMLYYLNFPAGTLTPKSGIANTKAVEYLLNKLCENFKKGIFPDKTIINKLKSIGLNNKSKRIPFNKIKIC